MVSVAGDRDEYVAPTRLPLGPGTLTRRINLEPVILLGGGRALLLQVAHPLVAAGVADHSDYRSDPWGRLVRTLETMSGQTRSWLRPRRGSFAS